MENKYLSFDGLKRLLQNLKKVKYKEIVMTDSVNGYDYIIQMQNGRLVSFCMCNGIQVSQLPNNISYMEGDKFDPTGMIVIAVCPDGSTREIVDYEYQDMITGSLFTISYTEGGITYNTTISLHIAIEEQIDEILLQHYNDIMRNAYMGIN